VEEEKKRKGSRAEQRGSSYELKGRTQQNRKVP
jgi:hypothetical protein